MRERGKGEKGGIEREKERTIFNGKRKGRGKREERESREKGQGVERGERG